METPTIFTNRDYDSLQSPPPKKGNGNSFMLITDQLVQVGDIIQWTSYKPGTKKSFQWYKVTGIIDQKHRSTYMKGPLLGVNASQFFNKVIVEADIVAETYTLETNAL
ncbi:MAG: hypothetical protein ACRBG0_13655 [Lewinella sp.]|uniref:hypothetical protein n=1 Tax=Lewinella sp. TaxID=2004506 RepID=UPI003D6AF31E